MSPILTLKDVSQHRKKDDIWLAIHGKVYDVTGFIDEHPGGEEVLADSAGTDASGGFDDVEHSDEAMNIIKTLQIGVLEEEIEKAVRSHHLQAQAMQLEYTAGTITYAFPSLWLYLIAYAGILLAIVLYIKVTANANTPNTH